MGDFFHASLWSVQSPQMYLCPHLPTGFAFRMILLGAKGCTQDSQYICWSSVILDLRKWKHTNQHVCSSKKESWNLLFHTFCKIPWDYHKSKSDPLKGLGVWLLLCFLYKSAQERKPLFIHLHSQRWMNVRPERAARQGVRR